jgi:hypothetical protein
VLGGLAEQGPRLVRSINVDVSLDPEEGVCLWVVSMHALKDTLRELQPLASAIALQPQDALTEMDCWWEMIQAYGDAQGYAEFLDRPFYSKNCFLDELRTGLASALVELQAAAPGGCGLGHFISFGGAVRDVPANATAFAWRSSEYMVSASCGYDDNDLLSRQQAVDWLNHWWVTLSPFCNGGSYVNFIDPLGRAQSDALYYGSNLDRLKAVKQQWNPMQANNPLRFPMELQDS